MFDYLLVFLADILLALIFILNKRYERHAGCTVVAGLSFNVQSGLIIAVIYFIVNGFHVDFTPYSFAMAALQTVAVTAYSLLGFYMLRDGLVATYTLFLMTGGMAVPYIWGIVFLNEEISFLRVAGIIIIIAGVIFANYKPESRNIKYLLTGASVFLLNGITSVSSKLHQIETVRPIVQSMDFVILMAAVRCVISLALLVPFSIMQKNSPQVLKSTVRPRVIGDIAVIAVLTGISSYALVRSAINLPATVLYPVNTGGTIVFSAVFGRIVFKERLTKQLIFGIAMCVAGTLCFL